MFQCLWAGHTGQDNLSHLAGQDVHSLIGSDRDETGYPGLHRAGDDGNTT